MRNLVLFCFLTILKICTGQTLVKNVDAAGFKKLIGHENTVLIDLRTRGEIESKGMIKGAVQLDFLDKSAEEQIKKLDKNKTYLLYCAGGGRSSDCAELMERSGFKDVVNLEGGFDNWKRKGFEVEAKTTK